MEVAQSATLATWRITLMKRKGKTMFDHDFIARQSIDKICIVVMSLIDVLVTNNVITNEDLESAKARATAAVEGQRKKEEPDE